jgi:hypothetical protein
MVDMELLPFDFIIECRVKLANQLKGRLRDTLISWAQPDQHRARVVVNHIHELYLLAALVPILLIDTDLVGPETAFPIRIPNLSQSTMKAISKFKASSITFVVTDGDLMAMLRLAPDVRKWLIPS